jgi:hypothetical protein
MVCTGHKEISSPEKTIRKAEKLLLYPFFGAPFPAVATHPAEAGFRHALHPGRGQRKRNFTVHLQENLA